MEDNRVEAYWLSYLQVLPPDSPVRDEQYVAEGWGESPELGALISAGIKTATCSALWEYEAEGERLPEAGLKTIVLDGNGDPLCIVESTEVEVRPYEEVDDRFAYEEGEGDRSLEYWREAHWRFFSRMLPNIGMEPTPDMPLVCERFRVVYRDRISATGMETRELTIKVDAEAANACAAASSEGRKKINVPLSLRLSQVTAFSAPLEQVMRKISGAAQERDLTEEHLSDILREE